MTRPAADITEALRRLLRFTHALTAYNHQLALDVGADLDDLHFAERAAAAPEPASPDPWAEALKDPATRAAIDEGLADVAAGRTKPWPAPASLDEPTLYQRWYKWPKREARAASASVQPPLDEIPHACTYCGNLHSTRFDSTSNAAETPEQPASREAGEPA